jgi:hypothetical protein
LVGSGGITALLLASAGFSVFSTAGSADFSSAFSAGAASAAGSAAFSAFTSAAGFSAGAASVVGTTWISYNGMQYVIAPSSPDSIVRSLGAMETILLVDAAKILKEGVTLDLDVYDVFGKNGFVAYLTKIFAEIGIDTASLQTISQVEKAIESKSDEEYYENLRKLIEIAKNLQ